MIPELNKRKKSLDKHINHLKSELSKLPKGQIVCYPNGKYSRWYLKTDHGLEWIPKKNREFASKLAYRKYLEGKVSDLMHEYEILSSYQKFESNSSKKNFISQSETILENPHYAALIGDQMKEHEHKWSEWCKQGYPCNPKFPEQKIHPTISGILVRSKSEAMIERILSTNNIAFRYEPAFEVDGITIYPDFLIIHPQTDELFIWEHFGMMDNSEYAHHAFRKMELYNSAGYIPNEKLITTFEKKDFPFTFEKAENIVHEFFLN